MNTIQCFDGMGGPVIFLYQRPPDKKVIEVLSQRKTQNSYLGRACRAIIEAEESAYGIRGLNVAAEQIDYRTRFTKIRIGLSAIEFVAGSIQGDFSFLLDLRNSVDFFLELLGIHIHDTIREHRELLNQPDALSEKGSITLTLAKDDEKSIHFTLFKAKSSKSRPWDDVVMVEVSHLDQPSRDILTSIIGPHRLKSLIFSTPRRRVIVRKPTVYFCWQGSRFTMCLGKPQDIRQTNGGKTYPHAVRGSTMYSEREEKVFVEAMIAAESALVGSDALAVSHG